LNKKDLLTLFGGLTQVSPNLERLDLHRKTAEKHCPITFRVISGSMPSLKDLRLACIDLTPEILQLRHLVHLKLEHPFPSLTAILDLITSNPMLETIALRVKCTGQTDSRPKWAVTIPRLRVLKFECYPPLPLFHQLSIPRGASVSFLPWDDAKCGVVLPDSLDHLRNAWEIRNVFVQRKRGHWIEASGPSGEVRFEDVTNPLPELLRLPLQSVEKFRYAEVDPFSDTISKELDRGWIFRVFRCLRNLQTIVISSCGLEVMTVIFRLLSSPTDRIPSYRTYGAPLRPESLPSPTLSTMVLEVPRDGSWDDWAAPFLQMLRIRAAAGSRLKKVRIVSDRGVHIPRLGDEKRRQMGKLVSWVEVKHFRYEKDGMINERRARELFEWQHGEDGFSGVA
jgi:hypothetical protein